MRARLFWSFRLWGCPPRPPFRLRDPACLLASCVQNMPGPGGPPARGSAERRCVQPGGQRPHEHSGSSPLSVFIPLTQTSVLLVCEIPGAQPHAAAADSSAPAGAPRNGGGVPHVGRPGPGPARGLCALENRGPCLPHVPPKAGVLPGAQHLPSGAAVPPTLLGGSLGCGPGAGAALGTFRLPQESNLALCL